MRKHVGSITGNIVWGSRTLPNGSNETAFGFTNQDGNLLDPWPRVKIRGEYYTRCFLDDRVLKYWQKFNAQGRQNYNGVLCSIDFDSGKPVIYHIDFVKSDEFYTKVGVDRPKSLSDEDIRKWYNGEK